MTVKLTTNNRSHSLEPTIDGALWYANTSTSVTYTALGVLQHGADALVAVSESLAPRLSVFNSQAFLSGLTTLGYVTYTLSAVKDMIDLSRLYYLGSLIPASVSGEEMATFFQTLLDEYDDSMLVTRLGKEFAGMLDRKALTTLINGINKGDKFYISKGNILINQLKELISQKTNYHLIGLGSALTFLAGLALRDSTPLSLLFTSVGIALWLGQMGHHSFTIASLTKETENQLSSAFITQIIYQQRLKSLAYRQEASHDRSFMAPLLSSLRSDPLDLRSLLVPSHSRSRRRA